MSEFISPSLTVSTMCSWIWAQERVSSTWSLCTICKLWLSVSVYSCMSVIQSWQDNLAQWPPGKTQVLRGTNGQLCLWCWFRASKAHKCIRCFILQIISVSQQGGRTAGWNHSCHCAAAETAATLWALSRGLSDPNVCYWDLVGHLKTDSKTPQCLHV